MGAKIGKNITLGGRVPDAAMLEIDDDTVIGANSILLTHDMNGNNLTWKKIKIGKRCVIAAGSIIMSGVVMEDGSKVGANSVVLKNTRIPKGELWAGVPAKRIKKYSKT
jgi:acetyltransferase-like isoleucine patch superfamily enzyme